MQTFVRVREQVHSNLVGLHIDSIAGATNDRLVEYANAIGAHTTDLGVASSRAAQLLNSAVTQQASVLAYVDGFLAAGAGAFGCLVLVAAMRRGPPSAF
jgi:DHA2 family multidrug resistance protein